MARYTKGGDVVRVPQINAELEKIEQAFENVLSRDGDTPNQMNAPIDMNGNKIVNVQTDITDPNSLVQRSDLYVKSEVDAKDAQAVLDANAFAVNQDNAVLAAAQAYAEELSGEPVNTVRYVQEEFPVGEIISGARWYKPSEGVTYVYYVDGDSAQWVQETVNNFEGTLRTELAATNSDVLVGGVEANVLTNRTVFVDDFGAKGDGVTDDTAAIAAAATSLTDNVKLEFRSGATYLISYENAVEWDAAYGKAAMFLEDIEGVVLEGNNATIKIVDHDCSVGGLTFFVGRNVRHSVISRLRFDMTFVGTNTLATKYPWCGAIIYNDGDETGTRVKGQYSENISVVGCTFKLFHPFGSYVTTSNPFNGDPNNGYKLFSVFIYGDRLATDQLNQNKNVDVTDNVFLDGHNGYGVWVWAYSNVSISRNTAESWVTKRSNTSGVFQGGGVPFIRYHQWSNTGFNATNNFWRGKPCDKRTVSGFEGTGEFIHVNTNILTAVSAGDASVTENHLIGGNGDAANGIDEKIIFILCNGKVDVSNNTFNAIGTTTNASTGSIVSYFPNTTDTGGRVSLQVSNNVVGYNASHYNFVRNTEVSPTSASNRRLKSLAITNNVVNSHAQYFVDSYNGGVIDGCENQIISGNIFRGSDDTLFGSASSNSRGIRLGSVAGDTIRVENNIIKDVHTVFNVEFLDPATDFRLGDNAVSGETLYWSGSKPNQFTPTLEAASGSFDTINYVAEGQYTVVGDLCTVFITMRTSGALTLGTASGELKVGNLPFIAGSGVGGVGAVGVIQLWGSDFELKPSVQENTGKVRFLKNASNAPVSYLQVSDLSLGGGSFENLLTFSVTYPIN